MPKGGVAYMNLRVATYNVWSGRNNLDKKSRNYDLTAKTICELAPDIIGLQEVSNRPFADFPKFDAEVSEYLGKKTNMYSYYAPATEVFGCKFGNAILSKYPIKSAKTVMIPDENADREKRCVLVAQIDVCGGITVIVSHFGFADEEHICGVNTVLSLVRDTKSPVIFMGDLNSMSDNINLKPLFEELNDVSNGADKPYTWPSAFTEYVGDSEEKYGMNKNRKVDYIFNSSQFNVVRSDVFLSRASDHLPFYADLEIV